ncbi:MAG: methionyl-tRNA formyltransferase, partial [Demequina sp.]
DTAGELLARLAIAGAPLLVQSLEALDSGAATPVRQSTEGVSYAHKLTREDAYVAWERPAHVVDRQIRGCTPAPGAWTTLPDGTVAKLGPVTIVEAAGGSVPGQLTAKGDEVQVGTGAGRVALSWIAPAGKKAMPAAQWWRGARLSDSAVLGEA